LRGLTEWKLELSVKWPRLLYTNIAQSVSHVSVQQLETPENFWN